VTTSDQTEVYHPDCILRLSNIGKKQCLSFEDDLPLITGW
jgi:hypothetical protein